MDCEEIPNVLINPPLDIPKKNQRNLGTAFGRSLYKILLLNLNMKHMKKGWPYKMHAFLTDRSSYYNLPQFLGL